MLKCLTLFSVWKTVFLHSFITMSQGHFIEAKLEPRWTFFIFKEKAGTWCANNVGSTSMRHHDVASTLAQHCFKVVCPLRDRGTGLKLRERTKNQFSYFSTKSYVVGTQKNRLNETVLLSTQNICLNWWVRNFLQFYVYFYLNLWRERGEEKEREREKRERGEIERRRERGNVQLYNIVH